MFRYEILRKIFYISVKAKHLIQVIILGSQVVGRAFARALRQELQCMKSMILINMFDCFNLDAKTSTQSGKTTAKTVQADRVTGMSLQVM